jgi:predicted Rossmann-fold nucleotide-binding protein
MREIHSIDELAAHLKAERSLKDTVVQSVDTTEITELILQATIDNTVFLGCVLPDDVLCAVVKRGASVFPTLKGLPFNPYAPVLYSAETLFDGFDPTNPCSYCQTTDARVYQHWLDTGESNPATIADALARRLHDMAMTDGIEDFLQVHASDGKVVGMMGGHSMKRSDDAYLIAAKISKELTGRGYLMVSGGGPGAMEATHVGAWFVERTDSELEAAVRELAAAPSYKDKRWLACAFEVREKYPLPPDSEYVSLGIPTWLYGHEPPTPFATHIAKYFANSVREDGLVTIAHCGLIFAPGSAGTIQEIFQDATQNHYATTGVSSPMVFLDTEYWTKEKPVYPMIQQLAQGYDYENLIAIFDDVDSVVEYIEDNDPIPSSSGKWSFCSAHCGSKA